MSSTLLEDAVIQIARAPWNTSALSEAAVRQSIVLRLLHACGFDPWNPQEVQPEETNAAGNRPDLIVRVGNGAQQGFVLEIKRRGVTLEEGALGQALAYAGHIGLRWVWLTNGQTWILADEKKDGAYKEREVLRLELTSSHFAEELSTLLERSVWQGGTADKALERLLVGRHTRQLRQKVELFQKQKGLLSAADALEWMQDKGLLSATDAALLEPVPEAAPPSQALLSSASSTLFVSEFPVKMSYERREGKGVALVHSDGVLELQPGSLTVAKPLPSFPQWTAWMAQLELKGAAERLENGQFRIVKPIRYAAPSSAASLICGGAENGRIAWKTQDGIRHKDLFPYATHNEFGKGTGG